MTNIHQRLEMSKRHALGRLIAKTHSTPIRISHQDAPVHLKVRSDKRWMMIVFTLMLVELGVIMAYGLSY